MSLSQRLQRIESTFSQNQRERLTEVEAETRELWRAGLELLSLEELDRLEVIYKKIIDDTAQRGGPDGHWMHELLDQPCVTPGERDELIAIFLAMGFDLVAMAAAGRAQ